MDTVYTLSMAKTNEDELTLAGRFYRDRDKWLRYLMTHTDIKETTARLVGCYIGMNINRETRDLWKQETTIATDLGISRSTVMRSVRALEDAELVEVKRDGRRGMKKAVNRYSMVFPWLPK